MWCTILLVSGATDGIDVTGSALAGVSFRDFSLRTSSASSGKALSVAPGSLSEDFLFDHVNFDTTGSGVWTYGIWAQNLLVSNFNSLRFRLATSGVPLHLDTVSNSNTLTGIDIGGTYTTGLELSGADNTRLLGGTIEGNASNALVLCTNVSSYTSGLSVHGTFFQNATGIGISATAGCDNLNLDGIWLTGAFYTSGISTSATSFALKRSYISINASTAVLNVVGTGTSVPVLIEGSFLENVASTKPVIIVDGVNNPNITGGNKIFSTKGVGISLGPSLRVLNPVITGNELPGPSGTTGIVINGSTVTGGIYTGNTFDGAGSSAFLGVGIGGDFRFGNSSSSGTVSTADSWVRVWDGGNGAQFKDERAVTGNGSFNGSGAAAITFAGGFTFFSSSSYRCFVSPLTTPVGIAWNTSAANAITVNSSKGSDSQGFVYLCIGQ